MICDSINVTPAPNNGTLRLPLKPIGLHSDPDTPANETPSDPPPHSSSASPSPSPSPSPSEIPSPASTPPASQTSSAPPAQSSEAEMAWWQYLTHKAQHMQEWVDEFLKTHMPGKSGKANEEEKDG